MVVRGNEVERERPGDQVVFMRSDTTMGRPA